MNLKELMNETKIGETLELVTTEQAIYRRTKNGLQRIKLLNKNIEVSQIHQGRQQ